MQVIHSLGNLTINKNVNGNAGFLLANKKGSYCSFFNAPSSRFYGLFYFDEESMNMYRFIESIEIANGNDVSGMKNGFYFAERRKNDIVESFMMPKNFSSLLYELSAGSEIDIVLDCKGSYDSREWGRYYEIFEEKGCIVVKFTKKTDSREDSSNGVLEFELYLAIKSDKNPHQKNDKWVERDYYYDKERKSPPFKRYVYNALRLKGSKFVFSMSKKKNDAVRECIHVFGNSEYIKGTEKGYFFDMLKKDCVKNAIRNKNIGSEIKIAYINALNSLNNLAIDGRNYGLMAGLPWFFQFWARDTLVSLKALSKINERLSRKLLYGYLGKINDEGRLPNLAGEHSSSSLGSADAHGWLFLRCSESARSINASREIINSIKNSIRSVMQSRHSGSSKIKRHVQRCSSIIKRKENECLRMIYEIKSSLEKSLNFLLKFHTENHFEMSKKLETWMDTGFENDKREGIRVEIQALRLNMYRLMFELSKSPKYMILENLLKAKSREKLWNGKILADGLNDSTIRPNIFIAAYAYPELLSHDEWEACFGNALKSLWLDWGGLSTIDKNSSLFADTHTGEVDIKSYHRGDSWFWINNLAALVLSRTNKNKFHKNIKKIIDASTEEILWKGCIGCHSELSSAKELSSKGCFSQAWSCAMYVEMIDEVFGID